MVLQGDMSVYPELEWFVQSNLFIMATPRETENMAFVDKVVIIDRFDRSILILQVSSDLAVLLK